MDVIASKLEKRESTKLMIQTMALPLILLISCTFCIQFHAFKFWNDVVGSYGLVWSLTIEGTAIFLWVFSKVEEKPAGIIFLAILATTISLVAPAIKNVQPLYVSLLQVNKDISSWDEIKDSYEVSIDELKKTISESTDKSKSRGGFLTHINKSEDELMVEREKLRNHLKYKPAVTDNFDEIVKISTILIALLVLQISSVLLSRKLGVIFKNITILDKESNATFMDLMTESKIKLVSSNELNDDQDDRLFVRNLDSIETEVLIPIIQKLVEKYKDNNNLRSSKELSEKAGVKQNDLSFLMNHETLMRKKDKGLKVRCISRSRALEVASKIGIQESDICNYPLPDNISYLSERNG